MAFLCGYLANKGRNAWNCVNDHTQNQTIVCSFSCKAGFITIFDLLRNCYLTGRYPSFYDYGVSQYIYLTKMGSNMFKVFDYATGTFLSVTCTENLVSIYDYSKGRYFNYSLN